MKRLLAVTAIFLSMLSAASASAIMVCDGAHARIYHFDDQGNYTGYTEAGGCAGGVWACQLSPVIPHHDGDHELAERINANFHVQTENPPDDVKELYKQNQEKPFEVRYLDPHDLNPEVLEFLGW